MPDAGTAVNDCAFVYPGSAGSSDDVAKEAESPHAALVIDSSPIAVEGNAPPIEVVSGSGGDDPAECVSTVVAVDSSVISTDDVASGEDPTLVTEGMPDEVTSELLMLDETSLKSL